MTRDRRTGMGNVFGVLVLALTLGVTNSFPVWAGEETVTLTGTVRDASTHAGLSGVKIYVRQGGRPYMILPDELRRVDARSGQEGEFVVTRSLLYAGPVAIVAVADGYAIRIEFTTIDKDKTSKPVEIKLAKGREISGTVVHADGTENTAAEVYATSDAFPEALLVARVDRTGRFSFPHMPDDKVTLTACSSLDLDGSVQVPQGDTSVPDCRIETQQGVEFEGRVTYNGRPAKKAMVRVYHRDPVRWCAVRHAWTGASGQFHTLGVGPGMVEINVDLPANKQHPAIYRVLRDQRIAATSPSVFNTDFIPGNCSLSGTVRLGSSPVQASILVKVTDANSQVQDCYSVESDKKGRFHISGLPGGQALVGIVTKGKDEVAWNEQIELSRDGLKRDFTCKEFRTIHGVIRGVSAADRLYLLAAAEPLDSLLLPGVLVELGADPAVYMYKEFDRVSEGEVPFRVTVSKACKPITVSVLSKPRVARMGSGRPNNGRHLVFGAEKSSAGESTEIPMVINLAE